MEIMTTDKKLLAQDDIDALLGEAGLEGSYKSEKTDKEKANLPAKNESPIRFNQISLAEARKTLENLFKKTFLERDDEVRVIWNAFGSIPMVKGQKVNIQGIEYISVGTLYENHLFVKKN